MTLPVILGENGVDRVINLELDEDDKKKFDTSRNEV